MIEDTTRKVLRILFNMYRDEEFYLDLDLLSIYSARRKERVKDAIRNLIRLGYLNWHPTRDRYKIDCVKFQSDYR